MSSAIQFPQERIYYPGIDNPLFIQDIQVANQSILDGLRMITGLNLTDFAILSGLDYVPGTPNTYLPGFIFLYGQFYYVSAAINEGVYLKGNIQQILPEAFEEDGVSRPIYYQYGSTVSNTGGADFSPVFSGDMNNYRISLSNTQKTVNVLNGIIANLGNSSTLNVGTTAGTVAAGNDSRFGYSKSEIDTMISNRIPSYKGALYYHYDIDDNFAANFNGSGIGIVFPWIGWALMDGQGGRANATGKMFVGVGTGFAPKSTGGNSSHTLTIDELPEHNFEYERPRMDTVGDQYQTNRAASGSGTGLYTGDIIETNSIGSGESINIQNPYISVYVAVKIV